MNRVPQTHYAKADDGVHIAYQVFGDGLMDLVVVPGFISHVELMWEEEAMAPRAASTRLVPSCDHVRQARYRHV